MIFYFSGTGNSMFVASQLAAELHDEARFMNDSGREHALGFHGNSLGFVFPVYSWGVPPNVLAFLDSLPDSFFTFLKEREVYVWAVMTCGDETALAPEMLRKALAKHGVALDAVWSVIMPNNYVVLPGFDVDPKDLEKKKLAEAPRRISAIAEEIESRVHTFDVTRGSMPWLKTNVVWPLFKRWGISPGKWHATESCVGCSICARSCPQDNIKMIPVSSAREQHPSSKLPQNPEEPGRKSVHLVPEWGDDCCSCLACYHSCPRNAVQYGRATRKKGQYFLR